MSRAKFSVPSNLVNHYLLNFQMYPHLFDNSMRNYTENMSCCRVSRKYALKCFKGPLMGKLSMFPCDIRIEAT